MLMLLKLKLMKKQGFLAASQLCEGRQSLSSFRTCETAGRHTPQANCGVKVTTTQLREPLPQG